MIRRGRLYIKFVCEVVCYTEVRPGLSGKKMRWLLQRADMRMVRWMCDVKVKDRVPSKEVRETLGIDYIILVLQENRLRQMCCKKKTLTGEEMYGI